MRTVNVIYFKHAQQSAESVFINLFDYRIR